MTVEFNTGSFVNHGKVIATVVTRERSVDSYNLDPPQICFVIKLPNGFIIYKPIKNCRVVPNLLQRFASHVRLKFKKGRCIDRLSRFKPA